ncbi:MAG: hypothetical protein ACAF41_04350 [Leptolyngbya sp. BL-A-14]
MILPNPEGTLRPQSTVGHTVIAIAHRLSIIAKATKVVMAQGQIVEQNTYQNC